MDGEFLHLQLKHRHIMYIASLWYSKIHVAPPIGLSSMFSQA